MGVATFDYAGWLVRYPEFTGLVLEPQATAFFSDSGILYLDNSDGSAVQDVAARQLILYMIVAHLAKMSPAGGGQGAVGRVAEASEGTVRAKLEYKGTEDSAWWDQTNYGAAAYKALLPYRMGRYVPAPPQPQQPYIGGGRLGYSSWPWPT